MPIEINLRHTPVCRACADDVGVPVAVTVKQGRKFVTIRCQGCRHEWEEDRGTLPPVDLGAFWRSPYEPDPV
jgi:hypothetical protein